MNILLTGGAGYIGSHTAVVLAQEGHQITLFDNLCNCQGDVVFRIEKILGMAVNFVVGDVRDTELLVNVLRKYQIDSVIHFAGLKSVSESVINPLLYFSNNVQGSISLLQAMNMVGVKKIVFSSSATVYGRPVYLPYDESHPVNPINPYGDSKLQVEVLLKDLVKSDASWRIACLRYFNPVGAHESGLIGDNPLGKPENLMPYLARVASGNLEYLNIFGNDYETKDGTGERDYIHVMDLAEGHMSALHFLSEHNGFSAINLGTGKPTSVLECWSEFKKASGKNIPIKFAPRRPGDLPIYFAKVDQAKKALGWSARRSVADMCASAWRFQENLGKTDY